MPDMTGFQGGRWNATCDICGRVFKSDQLTKAWDASMRCDECYETRHPQDFVKGVSDNSATPWSRDWVPQFVLETQIWITSGGQYMDWIYSSGSPGLWQH